MSGTPYTAPNLRLFAAAGAALVVSFALGPPGGASALAAFGLALFVMAGGWVRQQTDALSVAGRVATGAMGVLMMIPAIGLRMHKLSATLATVETLSAHDAISRIPELVVEVPIATGPLLIGLGLAVVILTGRMGSPVAGAAFGGAIAAEAGRTISAMVLQALEDERFEDAVLLSQSLRFFWLLSFVGLLVGVVIAQHGHKVMVLKRMARLRAYKRELILRERDRAWNEAKKLEAERAVQEARETGDEVPESDSTDEATPTGSDDEGMNIDLDGLVEPTPSQPSDADLVHDPQELEVPASAPDSDEGGGLDLDDLEDEAPPARGEKEEEEEEEEEEVIVHVSPEEVDPDHGLAPEVVGRKQRISAGLLLLVTMASGWVVSVPWWSVVRALPKPATGVAVPRAEPGLPMAQRPMLPFQNDFAAALEGRGHRLMHGPVWPCLPDTYDKKSPYGSHPRSSETLAVAADTPVLDLYDAVNAMRRRGVFRMGLTGAADPPYGPLGRFLAWPAARLFIDRPPRTLQWFKLFPRSVEKLPLLPGATDPAACALAIQEGVSVQQLYSTVRSLGSPYGERSCQRAIVLVFPEDSATKNPHPGWRGCP